MIGPHATVPEESPAEELGRLRRELTEIDYHTPEYCMTLDRIAVLVREQAGTRRSARAATYRLWVNAERTVLVRLWPIGAVEVATRESPAHTWGPPVALAEEKV